MTDMNQSVNTALAAGLCALTLACADHTAVEEAHPAAAPIAPQTDTREGERSETPAPLGPAERERLESAQQAMRAGLPEQVHAQLGGLLERRPVPADVQFVAGSAAYDLHDYGEAVERLSDAIRLKPEYLPNSSALGFCYVKLGDFEAAREAFARIVEVAPEKHKAHYGLGLVALAQGELDEARISLTQCLRLSPEYLKGLFAMARLLDAEGRSQEALETLSVVTARWPSHDEALYLKGRLLTSLGREPEAKAVFARHASVYKIKESLGSLAAQLGGPNDGPDLRLQMAALHTAMGDRREAGRTLSAARRLYPDDRSLAEAWKRLTQDP